MFAENLKQFNRSANETTYFFDALTNLKQLVIVQFLQIQTIRRILAVAQYTQTHIIYHFIAIIIKNLIKSSKDYDFIGILMTSI